LSLFWGGLIFLIFFMFFNFFWGFFVLSRRPTHMLFGRSS
jgi:hypothetical protein